MSLLVGVGHTKQLKVFGVKGQNGHKTFLREKKKRKISPLSLL